jgi:hypothetical protein
MRELPGWSGGWQERWLDGRALRCDAVAMRTLAVFLLGSCLALADEPPEGVVWYDADGKVAYVEGPAAEPLPPRLVPEWKRREARREEGARTGDFHFRRYPGWYGYRGWSVVRTCAPRPVRTWCPRPPHRPPLIIIR